MCQVIINNNKIAQFMFCFQNPSQLSLLKACWRLHFLSSFDKTCSDSFFYAVWDELKTGSCCSETRWPCAVKSKEILVLSSLGYFLSNFCKACLHLGSETRWPFDKIKCNPKVVLPLQNEVLRGIGQSCSLYSSVQIWHIVK